jgi:predicted P-loop ATPase
MGVIYRKMNVAQGYSSKLNTVSNREIAWTDLVEELRTPIRTGESTSEYHKMSKEAQNNIKNVGYYIFGYVKGGMRKKDNVQHIDILALDIDNDIDMDDLPFAWEFVLHSTHSHRPDKPRYRMLVPLSRGINIEEHAFLSRHFANMKLDIDSVDPQSFVFSQVSYKPSIPKDADYVFIHNSGMVFDVDTNLVPNWKDITTWSMPKQSGKQQDPLEKPGIVGAFCKTYSVEYVLDTFLSDFYLRDGDRYTHVGSTLSKGGVVYDHKFFYSFHAKDPNGGKLLNAFDLYRVYLFGDDADSNRKMTEFAINDPAVKKTLLLEKTQKALADFGVAADDTDWLSGLVTNKYGVVEPSQYNTSHIIANMPGLKGLFGYNQLTNRVQMLSDGFNKKCGEAIEDTTITRLTAHIEYLMKPTKLNCNLVLKAVNVAAEDYAFHPIKAWIESLHWDGKKRIETLFIDYLKAEDSKYTRETAKKLMVGAVKRLYEPGCKFDFVPILEGKQGIKKSTFWKVLGNDWTAELTTFEPKAACEIIMGNWIIETSELEAFTKHEVERIKTFFSQGSDRVRLAYDRLAKTFPRQCVFVGSTNKNAYLKDTTGNRRFWPIACNTVDIDICTLKQNIDLLWAEAYHTYKTEDIDLYLQADALAEALTLQQSRALEDEWTGMIIEFLNSPGPVRRYQYDIDTEMEERKRVCVNEIWTDLFQKRVADLEIKDAKRIKDILNTLPGWSCAPNPIHFGVRFGKSRGWIKT